MKATTDADQALSLLHQEHVETRQLIDQLDEDQMRRPDTIRHGLYPNDVWSFADLLAHMTAYERHALNAAEAFELGDKHSILDRVVRDGRRVHAKSVADRRGKSPTEIIDEWQANAYELELLIEAADETKWREPASFDNGKAWDYGGVIERVLVLPPRPLYRHLPVHIPDPDAYLRRLVSGLV